MVWKIAICDDNLLYCDKMHKLCQERLEMEYQCAEFYIFENGEELLKGTSYFHMLFLDVEMEGMDGFQVAKELNKSGYQGKIIYITSHDEWVQRAFEVNAYRYIYKKDIRDIPNVMMDVINDLTKESGIVVRVKDSNNQLQVIQYGDIYALESIGDATAIILENMNTVTTESVEQLMERMDQRFILYNRGKAVNLQKVKSVSRNQIILRDGSCYKVSRRKWREVQKEFLKFVERSAKYY
ncbi:MAG: LytTR family DNA-binding domain-containing protein [Anaerostipes sp.]|nr:LytTR family DNA-binding domain-containing protein [Anaerostipes sp.]